MFEKVNVPTLGIVENMSYYSLPDGTQDFIFGKDGGLEMCKELGLNLLGRQIPINKTIREGGDSGMPVAEFIPDSIESKSYLNIAKTIVKEVNFRNIKSNKKPELEINI